MKRVDTGADGVDVRRIDTELLQARAKDNYQETGLLGVLETLAFGEHLILMGDKGSGKTLNAEQWAVKHDVPFLRFGCTGESGDRQLLGGFVLKSLDESWYTLGALPTAIDTANECGQCVLVLEEINALNEEAQKSVNSIADYRREVSMPGIGLVMRLDEPVLAEREGVIRTIEPADDDEHRMSIIIGVDEYEVPRRTMMPWVKEGAPVTAGKPLCRPAQLWLIGTMNPGYGGTYDLNEDFRSRFQFIRVDFMNAATEEKIFKSQFTGSMTPAEKLFVRNLQTLAKDTRGGKLGYALSTRDIEQTLKAYILFTVAGDRMAIQKALKLLEGKFPARSVPDFRARVRSTFKNPAAIDLGQVSLY